ncbi:unnamed protein product [Dicrocoelium dendriticum]|nr:unnamed protein product [Dicrocoelium dendriticum]
MELTDNADFPEFLGHTSFEAAQTENQVISDNENEDGKLGRRNFCYCHVSREGVRKRLHRSKIVLEEHLCYPWLRRLVFHLSHYFPNLHTTRPTSKHPRGKSVSRQVIQQSQRPKTVPTHVGPVDENSEDGQQRMKTNMSAFIVPPQQTMCGLVSQETRNLNSPDYCSRRRPRKPKGGRYPLRRQKSSGLVESDLGITKSEDAMEYPVERYENHYSDGRKSFNSFESSRDPGKINKEYSSSKTSRCSPNPPNYRQRQLRNDNNESSYEELTNELQEGVSSASLSNTVFEEVSKAPIDPAIAFENPTKAQGVTNRTEKPLNPSDDKSIVQYRRVKPRRNSSAQQCEPGMASGRLMLRCSMDDRTPLQRRLPTEQCPVEQYFMTDIHSVNKHVESWLEESMQVAMKKKQRRRNNVPHLSSADTAYETMDTPIKVAQPHSFDGPTKVSSFEQNDTYLSYAYSSTPLVKPDSHTYIPSVYPVMRGLHNSAFLSKEINADHADSSEFNICRQHLKTRLPDDRKMCKQSKHAFCSASQLKGIRQFTASFESPTGSTSKMVSVRNHAISENQLPSQTISSPKEPLLRPPGRKVRAHSYQGQEQTKHDVHSKLNYLANNNWGGDNVGCREDLMGIKQLSSMSTPRYPTRADKATENESSHFALTPKGEADNTRLFIVPKSIESHRWSSDIYWQRCCDRWFTRLDNEGGIQHQDNQIEASLEHNASELSRNGLLLSTPTSSALFQRRYSHHLKPLDACNDRQAHSMELVNAPSYNCRSISKSPNASKTFFRPCSPVMYSRSVQQSTGSFPPPWGGFFSGPELSLNSPHNSSNITPESLQSRCLFDQLTETSHKHGAELMQRSKCKHSSATSSIYHPSQKTMSTAYSCAMHTRGSLLSPTHLSPFPQPQVSKLEERKVRSFELNMSYGSMDEQRNSYLAVPSHCSLESSRRGSSLSGRLLPDFHNKPADPIAVTPQPTPVRLSVTNGPFSNVQQAQNAERLIPPDLVFSPASRRTSLMDEADCFTSVLDSREISNKNCDHQVPENEFLESPDCLPKIDKQEHGDGFHRSMVPSHGVLRRLSNYEENAQTYRREPPFWWQQACTYQAHPQLQRSCSRLVDNHEETLDHEERWQPELCTSPLSANVHSMEYLFQDTRHIQKEKPSGHKFIQVKLNMQNAGKAKRMQRIGNKQNALPSARTSRDNSEVHKHVKVSKSNRSKSSSVSQDRQSSDIEQGSKSVGVAKGDKHGVLPKSSKLRVIVQDNYIFRSSSTGDSGVDPKILEPSLGPVVDSSEENLTEYDDEDRGDLKNKVKNDIPTTGNKSKALQFSLSKDAKRPVSEKHAERRRSFLVGYLQQALQRSLDDLHIDTE